MVLDCSAEFHGTSLNKELLSEPDSSSQLVALLTRFRTEEVVFMDDIEAMFYQMHLAETERSFIRYLWWKGVNLEKLIDYEMCVHAFCGTYSLDVVITLYEGQLWLMCQVTAKKQLIPF